MSRAGGDLATYASRVWATLLDGLLIGVVAFTAAVIVLGAGAPSDATSIVIVVAALGGSLVYAPVLMCRKGARNGQTLGKQWLHIRVVRQDAHPITASSALLREFVGKGLLGLIPFFTIVDYLFPLGDARRQAIHDKLASTFVVREDAVPDLGDAERDPFVTHGPEQPAALAGWAPPSAAPPPARPTAEAPSSGSQWAPPTPAPPPPAASPPDAPAPAAPAEDDEHRGPSGPSSGEPR